MIKRIRFAVRRTDVEPDTFATGWSDAARSVAGAPPGVRPARAALCIALPEVLADPRYDGIGFEWFTDADHLDRFERWCRTSEGEPFEDELGRVLALGSSPVLVADERIMRGADWLDDRWRIGGVELKHMAIATRAAGLTPAQFSERWSSRAGQVHRSDGRGVVAIPDEARGLAYAQNHPRPGCGEPAHDALNEVWFDDLDGLRTRIDWFREHLDEGAERDLVSETWFVAAREELLFSAG